VHPALPKIAEPPSFVQGKPRYLPASSRAYKSGTADASLSAFTLHLQARKKGRYLHFHDMGKG